MKKTFDNIEDVQQYLSEQEKELENLRWYAEVFERIEEQMKITLGYWNSDKQEYQQYTANEVLKGETEDGHSIWLTIDEYSAKHDAYKRALMAILNI